MADSFTAQQKEQILTLGRWRDAGSTLAVGLDGQIFVHSENEENEDGNARQGAARRERTTGWEGTAGREGTAGQCTPSAPEPPRKVGRESLIEEYKAHLKEVRLYFDITVVETAEGIWLVAPMWPIGKGGPCFTVALHLPDGRVMTPTAFGFRSSGQLARPIGKRHTNSPEGSICAWSEGDIPWEPGDSPFLLLRLYAEWLLCHLFYQLEGYWPGRQSGLNEVYRWNEFKPNEWCDCNSEKRYGECHQPSDAEVVARLKLQGKSVDRLIREMPASVLRFARSGWREPPRVDDLPARLFTAS